MKNVFYHPLEVYKIQSTTYKITRNLLGKFSIWYQSTEDNFSLVRQNGSATIEEARANLRMIAISHLQQRKKALVDETFIINHLLDRLKNRASGLAGFEETNKEKVAIQKATFSKIKI